MQLCTHNLKQDKNIVVTFLICRPELEFALPPLAHFLLRQMFFVPMPPLVLVIISIVVTLRSTYYVANYFW